MRSALTNYNEKFSTFLRLEDSESLLIYATAGCCWFAESCCSHYSNAFVGLYSPLQYDLRLFCLLLYLQMVIYYMHAWDA